MEFRERLYQLRKGRGISQEELAHTVGVSRQAVQKWEAGAATPDLNNLSALADYFAVSLDYLVRGIEPEKPAAPSPQQAVIQNYYRGWRYESRSRRTLFGLPLVHINLCDRSLCRAKGVIAIGNVATGLNTAAIVGTGPLAKRLGEEYQLHGYRTANLLICSGGTLNYLMPYMVPVVCAAMMTAVDLPGAVPVSTLEIVTHQFYPILLLVMTIFAIVSGYGRTLLPDSRAFRESERAVRY